MKRLVFFLILGLSVFQSLAAQERSERRERGRDGGGPPPWMQGGPGGMRGGGPPPWMQGGPGGMSGGPPMFGGSDSERNERTIGMLRSMDRNGNGKLEPDEVPEYRRGFVSMMVSRMGGNPNGTIDLNDLARKASGSSSRSTSPSAAASTSSNVKNSSLPTDPLVPYFGEKEPEQPAVLAFGQREPQAKTASAARTSTLPALSQSDQVLRTARQIMSQFDKNKNGMLDKDKGEWSSSLPFNADSADKNRDGRISMSELIAALGGKTGVTTGAAAVATKQSEVYDRLPLGMPDWFFERDKNNDGQISMAEYLTNGQTWSEARADEFRFLDKNNDGTATAAEIIETLKQVDEEKRLKEDQAKREQERRRGVLPVPAQPATPAEGQPAQPGQPATPVVVNGQPSAPQPASPPPATGQPAVPAPTPEGQPNWKPGGSIPASAPSSAPYSSGSSNRDGRSDRERRDSTERTDRYRRPSGSDYRRR